MQSTINGVREETSGDPSSDVSEAEVIARGELECVSNDDLVPVDATANARDEALPPRAPSTALAAPGLQLPAEYVCEGERLRARFAAAEADAPPAEQVLESLIAGEVPIAMSLADSEGALAALLTRTLVDPKLALEVARVLREVVGLSGAVRRRIELCAGAVANLRAQRRFIEGHRGRHGR
jgi:hypothetical protein